MSLINVNAMEPSTGTDITLGASGDTITIPSGATITNSGTATGFGAALTGSTNNTVTTVTAANAISGETNLTFDGTDLTLGTGNIVFGTASKGVYLGVTSALAANLLDDYEEGTWIPSWSAGGGTLTSTSSNYGTYTKIGDMVSLWFGAVIDSGTASGYYRITNAPFTSATNGSGSYVNSNSGYMGTVWWDSGGTTVNMTKYDGTLETDPNLKVNIIMKV